MLLILLPAGVRGEEIPPDVLKSDESISLTPLEIVKIAEKLMQDGNLETAKILLLKTPFPETELEIERLFLLGRIAMAEKEYENAVGIFRLILDHHPNLARVRFELAQCYVFLGDWYRADYHMRLAASEKLPEPVMREIAKYLYVIRKNKNWNVWFNTGIANDPNANNASTGEECVMTMFGVLCSERPKPEKTTGMNVAMGGDYEFRFDNDWRIRNEAAVIASIYDKHDYDDWYVTAATGPKYVFPKGDMWLAATTSYRNLGGQSYNKTAGVKFDVNYDLRRDLSGGISLKYARTFYDDYGEFLDGSLSGASARLTYMFDSSKYLVFKTGFEKEDTEDPIYTNTRTDFALGFGCEAPFGFHIYLEPSVLLTRYDKERWYVKDMDFAEIRERSVTQRYTLSLSNRKIDIRGFTPVVTYSYTKRTSNVWQREYDKSAVSFTLTKRF